LTGGEVSPPGQGTTVVLAFTCYVTHGYPTLTAWRHRLWRQAAPPYHKLYCWALQARRGFTTDTTGGSLAAGVSNQYTAALSSRAYDSAAPPATRGDDAVLPTSYFRRRRNEL